MCGGPMTEHPCQPIYRDSSGVIRFKQNAIVRYLLDKSPEDMNSLALIPFSDEDRAQFAQLIGYSVGGYRELSYVDDAAAGIAWEKQDELVDRERA